MQVLCRERLAALVHAAVHGGDEQFAEGHPPGQQQRIRIKEVLNRGEHLAQVRASSVQGGRGQRFSAVYEFAHISRG